MCVNQSTIKLTVIVILISLAPRGRPQANEDAVSSKFAVRVVEAEIDLSPHGVTSNDCLLVQTDGSFQLERRFQRLPTPSATRTIYRGLLDDSEMEELSGLLRDESVIGLPKIKYTPSGGAPSNIMGSMYKFLVTPGCKALAITRGKLGIRRTRSTSLRQL